MDYKDYNDYELVYEIRENSEDAYNILITKYTTLIHKIAYEYFRKYKSFKVEYEDLIQEGHVGLYQALNDYDERSCLFYTYATICIKREIERFIKTFIRNKHMVLNNAISFSTPLDTNGELLLEDYISIGRDVEDIVIGDMNYNSIMNLKYDMSFEMAAVFELKANKFTILEISVLLDMPRRRVERYLLKIKKIIKAHLKKIN